MFRRGEISNRSIHARLFLPDPERGYYRATRFDWSAVIAGLNYGTHSCFDPSFEHDGPQADDAVAGGGLILL